jgi:hypothetical protein
VNRQPITSSESRPMALAEGKGTGYQSGREVRPASRAELEGVVGGMFNLYVAPQHDPRLQHRYGPPDWGC